MDVVTFLAGHKFDEETKTLLFKKFIHCNYDEKRVILSPANSSPSFDTSDPICRACNGLVLSYDNEGPKWEILSCPPPAPSNARLPNDISGFDVYAAEDGTIITFYYYNQIWLMSSTRGIDVGPIVWDGIITFEDAFFNSLAKIGITKQAFYEMLDQNRQMNYSFGFSHPSLHPFGSGQSKVWFVQAYDRVINQLISPTNFDHLKQPKIIGLTKDQIIQNCNQSVINFEEKGIVNHGYVLRSADQTFYIKSKLHRIISDLYYDHQYVINCKRYSVSRVFYMLVSVFANKNDRIFKLLFPNLPYLNKFDEFNKKITIAIDIIRDYMFKNVECTPIYKELIESIQRNITIKVSDKDFEINMRSAILTESNIPLLLRLLA